MDAGASIQTAQKEAANKMVLRISSRVAALVMFAVLALAPANAANPVFLTGSRVGLAPPASMVPSTSFRGFEDTDQHAAISITELPLQAYSQIEKSFTDDLL